MKIPNYNKQYLMHGAESFQQSLSHSRSSQHFMEPEGSLPYSQEPALVPILNQRNPVHTTPSCFSKTHFNIIIPPRLILPSGLFPSGLPINTLYAFLFSPMWATCPAHLILDLISLIVCGEEYNL
ncbi:hypothetical protein L798_09464 [Zootermopsis nevadensis]|uniref:Uncharacterized protein n=1 Tax=Zootermopsis nevadensis TaxID=136037 RepID=A0A067RAB7_ZOONE|nr:hypothetical protein L798_09464 [Zootermopsis nevadensis]